MEKGHQITMLGTGLIGMFYTATIHGGRSRDRIHTVYSRTESRADDFAARWGIAKATTDLQQSILDPDTDLVVVGLPNFLHETCVTLAAAAGKGILCTKPLGRTADEARRMLHAVEKAGVFAGYLEDLVYTPKTLKSVEAVQKGSIGQVLWVRSRETHPGPHSAWFWNIDQAGGGALVDMGCHCIEIIRSFAGKDNRPVEVMCWTDTLVHPIEAEDHGIALIRFESGAIGQFEVSWAFRGGMDLRDEVSGTEGTILLNHWLRTGFELFTTGKNNSYVAEKADAEAGWLFPVGDEPHALGYVHMFNDMLDAYDAGRAPRETFYDGYIVNTILDACYRSSRSKQWEPVAIEDWRARQPVSRPILQPQLMDGMVIIKEEHMPDGSRKMILKHPETGEVVQHIH